MNPRIIFKRSASSARVEPELIAAARERAYEQRAWLAIDTESLDRAACVMAVNEEAARIFGGVVLSLPPWRVRVRPALNSLCVA